MQVEDAENYMYIKKKTTKEQMFATGIKLEEVHGANIIGMSDINSYYLFWILQYLRNHNASYVSIFGIDGYIYMYIY